MALMKNKTTNFERRNRHGKTDALSTRLDRHFAFCSVALGATAAAVGGSTQADAAMTDSGAVNFAVPANSQGGVYINFDTGGISLVPTAGADFNMFDFHGTTATSNYGYRYLGVFGPNNANNGALSSGGANPNVLQLSAGQSIGAAGPFSRQANFALQFFTPGSGAPYGGLIGNFPTGTAFLGFRFVDAGGQTDFGWMRITFNSSTFVNNANASAATIVDWGWDNTGAAILAGAVPEPSSVALACLAGGAVGLMAWRRSRQSRAA